MYTVYVTFIMLTLLQLCKCLTNKFCSVSTLRVIKVTLIVLMKIVSLTK